MRNTALALAAVLGCTHRPALPATAAQVAQQDDPAALVAYLGQPDASAGVCAPDRVRPELRAARRLGGLLVAALREGNIPPERFAACALALLPGLAPERASDLAGRVLEAGVELAGQPALETDPALQGQLAALVRVALEREAGEVPRGVAERGLRELQAASRSATAGPAGQRAAGELGALLDAERGSWRGRPVDAAALDEAARDGGEPALLLLARRLPGVALRTEAERRLVRARIASSPFPEVRAGAGEVEARVLQVGTNPVSLDRHPPQGAVLDMSGLAARRVVLDQQVGRRSVNVFAVGADSPSPWVPAEIPLRGALQVRLAGLSGPVTVCASGRALDPAPCLAPADVAVGSPYVQPGTEGVLRLAERVSSAQAAALARSGARIEVPIAVGGQPLATLVMPVSYLRPPEFVLEGEAAGARGPDLFVEVERPSPQLAVYVVHAGERVWEAVVEWRDAARFRVVTRGAQGRAGSDGSRGQDGARGSDGRDASCLGGSSSDGGDGGAGGSGGDGGNGGPGGDGGDVELALAGVPGRLQAETAAVVRATFASEGGPGGRAGRGGRGGDGGAGGSGGSGTVCSSMDGPSTFLSSGRSGSSGLKGSDGSDGVPGPQGRPGAVRLVEGAAGS